MKYHNIYFLALLHVLLKILVLGEVFAQKAEDHELPNFLIVLVDDLGYGDLGCYGNPIIKTPNLDKLASEGFLLTDCYASAPMCSPSRAGLLTGRAPYRTGVYDWIAPDSSMYLPASEISIATLF